MVQVLVAAPQEFIDRLPEDADSVSFETVAGDGALAERLRVGRVPDVALLDFDFPGFAGLKGIQALRGLIGARPLGVIITAAPLELVRRLLAAGADAVLPAVTPGAALLPMVGMLATGQRFVVMSACEPNMVAEVTDHLSERELQVLQGICDGLQNKEIAHEFHVQEVTVKMHVRAIIRKLGARNRTHAAMIARDLGIV